MKDPDLERMDLDDLWDLHQRIIPILDRKLESEKRKLQAQLDKLRRKSGRPPVDVPQSRRRYPKVPQRFKNPDNPSQTWSGRGKTPQWLTRLMAAGRDRDEFKIE